MGIRVLGPISVDSDLVLRPRTRLVLGCLAVRSGHVVAPEEIADAVWAGRPPASWRKQIQICVAELRKVLPACAIETSADGGYQLSPQHVDVDAAEFEKLVRRGREFIPR